ncbi:BlaI/MecI/CopY family transcriptional regulator [Brevibacillus ruminantium]|uniref:BlaI/MecI/CopY family transcriptional regulator n=1 Tax=Brevibacillus ruminantium TaxID=2950604 RepID=A0ABY4WUS3_9BACL|nr:BlaI/MecI/CopY family transcriptional regulator [Brevibacillus ruminantium]
MYYPAVSEKECVKAESKSFVNRVFGGAAKLMVTNFLEEGDWSEKEIESECPPSACAVADRVSQAAFA